MDLPEKEVITISNIEKRLTRLNITELKEELTERKMKVSGVKQELIKRLAERMEEEEKEEEEEERREEEKREKYWINDRKYTEMMKSFNGLNDKTNISVQQWLKLYNYKCEQKNIPEQWKVEHISEYLDGKVLQYYIDFLMKEKAWKKIEEKITLQFGTQEEDKLNKFLNLKLRGLNDIEEYFREKSQLALQLGFQEKQNIAALTQGIEIEDLKKLMIATSPISLEGWKEIALLLAEATSRKTEHTPTPTSNQPTRSTQERPPWSQGRSMPSTPCRTCASLGVENAYHFQERCVNRGKIRQAAPSPPSGHFQPRNNSTGFSRRPQWTNATPTSSGHPTTDK